MGTGWRQLIGVFVLCATLPWGFGGGVSVRAEIADPHPAATNDIPTSLSRDAVEALSKALTTATAIEHAENRSHAFYSIAEAQAMAGHARDAATSLSKALTAAEKIEHAGVQSYAFLHIAQAQARAGDIHGAATSPPEPWRSQRESRTPMYRAVCSTGSEAQARTGNVRGATTSLSKALAAAERIDFADAQSGMFYRVAEAQVRTGNVRDAATSLSRALAAAKRIEDAEAQTSSLYRIVVAQVRTGNIQDALATAEQIHDTRLLLMIAVAQVRTGNMDALATAGKIGDPAIGAMRFSTSPRPKPRRATSRKLSLQRKQSATMGRQGPCRG